MQTFVWTKMQTAAGEALPKIVARKEAERAAGNGEFWWGIGNSLGMALFDAAKVGNDLPVLFSTMLSLPNRDDTAPAEVYLWTSYRDIAGADRDLPAHVIVTSRSGSDRLRYYALVCGSTVPIALGDYGPFDRRRCCTLSGKIPATTQVTALLRGDPDAGHDGGAYRVAFRARLVEPWSVKLTRCRVLSDAERKRLAQWDGGSWLTLARELRACPS